MNVPQSGSSASSSGISTRPASTRRRGLASALLGLAVVAAGAAYWFTRPPVGLPAPGSAAYRETVRIFYRGLASLEVGLLSDARDQFARASELAPREPAIHANLAIAQVGVGNDEGATAALETAHALAPDSAGVAFLQGQLASFSGRSEEAVSRYRRAAALDAGHERARFALAQELERSGVDTDLPEARQWLEEVLERRPENLAALLERARWAARTGDGAVLDDTIDRLTRMSAAMAGAGRDPVRRPLGSCRRRRPRTSGDPGAIAPQRAGPHARVPRGPGGGQRERGADRGAADAIPADAVAARDRGRAGRVARLREGADRAFAGGDRRRARHGARRRGRDARDRRYRRRGSAAGRDRRWRPTRAWSSSFPAMRPGRGRPPRRCCRWTGTATTAWTWLLSGHAASVS